MSFEAFSPETDFIHFSVTDFLGSLREKLEPLEAPPSPEYLALLLQESFELPFPLEDVPELTLFEEHSDAKRSLLFFLRTEMFIHEEDPSLITSERFIKNLSLLAREAYTIADWSLLQRVLRKSLEFSLVVRVLHQDISIVFNSINLNQEHEADEEECGLYVWVCSVYRMIYERHYTKTNRFFQIKAHPGGESHFPNPHWRRPNATEEQRLVVVDELRKRATKFMRLDVFERRLEAARIFNIAYPETVGIGNADADQFDEDPISHWDLFAPEREFFAGLLGRLHAFDAEWSMTAQVLWQHWRWLSRFREEPAAYFLEKAATLSLQEPAHYLRFGGPFKRDGKEVLLRHPSAINRYYWAEYLFYMKRDDDAALSHYLFFVEQEPELLPNNVFILDGYYHERLMYPASTQEALSQIARIYQKKKDFVKAEAFFLKAIALRPDNFQAPYERLAALLYQQGKTAEAITRLQEKITTIEGVRVERWQETHRMYLYIEFDPESGGQTLFYTTYQRTKVVYLYQLQQNLGEWLLDAARLDEAEQALRQALQSLKETKEIKEIQAQAQLRRAIAQRLLKIAEAKKDAKKIAEYRALTQ
jgi:tetratricopeptide (TPR) repeat protein